MNKIKEHLNSIIFLLTIIGSVVGGLTYIEGKFALADDVKELEQRVSLSELKQIYNEALKNLYFYRDQLRKYPDDVDLKSKLKESEVDVKGIKDQIIKLKSKD